MAYKYADIKTRRTVIQRLEKGIDEVNYPYEYPEGLNLKPGSEVHERLANEVYSRAQQSHRHMAQRHKQWAEVDKMLTMYVDLSDDEKEVKKADARKPVSIIIPTSYAVRETLLSYHCAAFLEDPILKYDWEDPEDALGVMLLERVISRHVNKFKVPLKLHTQWSDGFSYGIGVVGCVWSKKYAFKERSVPFTYFSPTSGRLEEVEGRSETVRDRKLVFEGNDLVTIDPYKFLPDPTVGPENIQAGEFVGWVDRKNLMTLLKYEASEDSPYFNIKYLKHMGHTTSALFVDSSSTGRYEKTNVRPDTYGGGHTNTVDIIPMYMEIVPKDWGLGDGEVPEKWFFCLAADSVIIAASPMGFNHDMYPISVDCPTYDGHTASPVSMMEMTYGLNETVNWLFSSHITNVRKAINDMIVYDPSIINPFDISDPQPGKLIRLRKSAWGRSVKDSFAQLQVNDITRNNIGDVSYINSIVHDTFGTVPTTGRRRGERVTATEIQADKSSDISRMQKGARITAWMGLYDIATMFASNTQQFMTEEVFVKTMGRYEEDLIKEYKGEVGKDRVKVRPEDLDVFYDVIVQDGTIPGDTDTQAWTQLFQVMAGSEPLQMKFDMVRIFKHIARGLGAKNVNDFQAKVMPDEQVRAQVEAGNLVRGEEL